MVSKENSKEVVDQIIQDNPKVLVKFGAQWCGPCKTLEPILETLSEELEDVVFVSVDIEEADELVSQYRIRNVPVMLIFKDGVLSEKLVGSVGVDTIKEKLS